MILPTRWTFLSTFFIATDRVAGWNTMSMCRFRVEALGIQHRGDKTRAWEVHVAFAG